MAQYVYTMNRVGKLIPPKRQILKDISLSFFPGAKIGVLGLNGAGKSTLLRIMAGVDREIEGEAVPMPGLKVGFLPQEPQLDPDQTVRHAVEEGMSDVLGAQKRLRRGLRGLRGGRRRFRRARGRAGEARGDHRGVGRRLRRADGDRRRRAAAAAVGCDDRDALRRREAPRRAVPAAAVEARHAAPGRADQPPRRRERGLARAIPAEVPGHRRRGDARSLLPRQCRRVDPRARPRLRHSVEGQLQVVARAEGAAARGRSEAGSRAHQGDEAGARVGAPEREGAAGQEQGAHRALQRARVLRAPEAQRDLRDLHSGRRAARQRGDRVQVRVEGLRRSAADRRSLVQGAAGRDRRRDRAERRRQDDALQADHRARRSPIPAK